MRHGSSSDDFFFLILGLSEANSVRLSGTLQCMELAEASGGRPTKLRIKKQVRLRIPPLIDTSAGGATERRIKRQA